MGRFTTLKRRRDEEEVGKGKAEHPTSNPAKPEPSILKGFENAEIEETKRYEMTPFSLCSANPQNGRKLHRIFARESLE
jgi:hypothetical protein